MNDYFLRMYNYLKKVFVKFQYYAISSIWIKNIVWIYKVKHNKKRSKKFHIDFIVLKERCSLSYRKVWPIPPEKLCADEPLWCCLRTCSQEKLKKFRIQIDEYLIWSIPFYATVTIYSYFSVFNELKTLNFFVFHNTNLGFM